MPNIQEEFTLLTKKRDDVANRVMRVNVTIEEAKRRQSLIVEQAKEKYGVSSVDELRAKLAAMKKENTDVIEAFRTALDVTEKKLVEAEAIIANTATPAAGARA